MNTYRKTLIFLLTLFLTSTLLAVSASAQALPSLDQIKRQTEDLRSKGVNYKGESRVQK